MIYELGDLNEMLENIMRFADSNEDAADELYRTIREALEPLAEQDFFGTEPDRTIFGEE